MAKNKNDGSEGTVDSTQRLETSDADKAKAGKWFQRARELGDKRQFDYAIEYYVNGLEFWPDAVEEACKPLHGCAVARKQLGGKKPGFKDTMKRSMTDKDPRRALVNSAWLFGHDPDNFSYMEGMAKAANRLHADDTVKWAGGLCARSLENDSKAGPKQFQSLIKLFEEAGDRAAGRGEAAFGVELYQMGVQMVNLWRQRAPKDRQADNELRELSTKLTILKGKYRDGETFRDSIADVDEQRDLQDQERSVQSDDRMDELVAKAEQAYKENPEDRTNLQRLVDLLTRREREDEETRAIGLLVNDFKQSGDYRRKYAADEIRMKQLGRAVRKAAKAGDEEAAKKAQVESLKYDLMVFKERVDKYPTDNRVKFEFGVRLFKAGRFDDAIPMFQAARVDPKNKVACGLYLGRCFFRKGYYSQAITTLEAELQRYQYSDDDLAKGMNYWLGRSLEANGDVAAARETYGKILQLDYNYRDVRDRLDGLPPPGKA